jgi:hypothetical protein
VLLPYAIAKGSGKDNKLPALQGYIPIIADDKDGGLPPVTLFAVISQLISGE